jgi:hypothetical protein
MLVWVIGPLVLLTIVLLVSFRRASVHGGRYRQARARAGHSETGRNEAMAEALVRLRGQELAHQARYEAVDGFLHQIVEGLPFGLIVVSPQGHVRVMNRWAAGWLQVPEPVEGRILWNVAGAEPLRALGSVCLDTGRRRDGTASGPAGAGETFPVTAVPLQTSAGEVDGILYLVHHERVS